MSIVDRRVELTGTVARLLGEENLVGDFGFDIAPQLVPTPTGGMRAGYVLVLTSSTGLARFGAPHFIADCWPDEETLREAVQTALKSLAASRRGALSIGNGN